MFFLFDMTTPRQHSRAVRNGKSSSIREGGKFVCSVKPLADKRGGEISCLPRTYTYNDSIYIVTLLHLSY
jgi:hypothetical protein